MPHPAMRAMPARAHAAAGAWLLTFSLAAGACDRAAEAGDAGLPHQGSSVVENRGDAPVAAWRLSAEPYVKLGGGGDPGFSMPTAVARTRDGFVVADAGTGQLRFFDPQGKPTRTVGRTGRGPGEFQFIGWIGTLPGDSVAVWDPSLRRVSIFGPEGSLARDFAPQGLSGSFPSAYGVFDDGTLLMSTGLESAGAPSVDGRAWRDTIALLRIGRTGEVMDTVARVPGPARYGATGASGMLRTNSVPFGPNTSAAVHGQNVYLATGERYEIGVYGAGGAARMRIRKQVRPLRVTDADRASYAANLVQADGTPEQRRERKKMIEDAPYPPTMSPVEVLVADQEGNVWVKEPQPPSTWDQFSRWSVFDTRGRWIATVETPGRFAMEEIGPDWVLGRRSDPDGTSYVGMYRLER